MTFEQENDQEAHYNPWDLDVQEYHGGQEWAKLDNFVEDFSVTTNALGTPQSGIDAVTAAVHSMHHYPPADQEPAKTDLARFLAHGDARDDVRLADIRSRLLLGNGASELIDLVLRHLDATATTSSSSSDPAANTRTRTWKTPFEVQYMEYERSATFLGWTKLSATSHEKADVLCIVNPNNPTGTYLPPDELCAWIRQHGKENAPVVIDESMQPWHSAQWRTHSFLHAAAAAEMQVYVVHSWTKLWCCTGLRLGSVVCPTPSHAQALRLAQVPWSVNNLALAFLSAATRDTAFLSRTWAHTSVWRAHHVALLAQLPLKTFLRKLTCHGAPFVSWIWVDVHSASLATHLVRVARAAGTPVRHGRHGYLRDTCLRIKVGAPEHFMVLYQAWKSFLESYDEEV